MCMTSVPLGVDQLEVSYYYLVYFFDTYLYLIVVQDGEYPPPSTLHPLMSLSTLASHEETA